jgi:hypothetical protein
LLCAVLSFFDVQEIIHYPLTKHSSVFLFGARVLWRRIIRLAQRTTQPTHIQGTVVNVKWVYPHIQFTIRGRDRAGAIVDLRVEASSPTILELLGWTKETLMPGMNVRVGGYPAKNSQYNDFGSTTVTIPSAQRVLKAPVCWIAPNNPISLADVKFGDVVEIR